MKNSWLYKYGNEVSVDILLSTYKEYREEKNIRYQMMMNETKFYVTIISALLSLTATGVAVVGKTQILNITLLGCLCVIIFLIIPIISFYLSYTGILHLKGSYIVYLEHISVLIKLENILKIDSKLKPIELEEQKLEDPCYLFKNDEYLIPNRWMKRRLVINNTEDFIEDVIKQPRSYYKIVRNVYILFIILSITIFVSGFYIFGSTLLKKALPLYCFFNSYN